MTRQKYSLKTSVWTALLGICLVLLLAGVAQAAGSCSKPTSPFPSAVTPLADAEASRIAVASVREGLAFSSKAAPADPDHRFSEAGWTKWNRMLVSSDVAGFVTRHLATAAAETGESSVLSSEACDGFHRWTIRIPVTVDYEGFGLQETQTLRLVLTLRQDDDTLGGVLVDDVSAE